MQAQPDHTFEDNGHRKQYTTRQINNMTLPTYNILILIPGKGVGAVSKRAFSPLPIRAGGDGGCITGMSLIYPGVELHTPE